MYEEHQFQETAQNSPEYLNLPITMEELNAAIETSKKKSSPGLDQIEYQMLKHTPTSVRAVLLSCLNHFLTNDIFPTEWKEFLIILLPKDSKSKFRPISLASCILKLMERILSTRILHYIEKINFIPKNQFGFRKGKSCSIALAKCSCLSQKYIVQLIKKKNYVVSY